MRKKPKTDMLLGVNARRINEASTRCLIVYPWVGLTRQARSARHLKDTEKQQFLKVKV